jgi:predicted ester cyclase
MTTEEGALRGAIERWNSGDLNGYLELYDAGIKLHGYSPAPMDKSGVKSFYEMIWATLPAKDAPSPRLDIAEVLVSGPRLACRFEMTGVHTGPFMGIPATGKPYGLPGITILHFEGARCIERWSSADMLGLLVQLGAVPPPGG